MLDYSEVRGGVALAHTAFVVTEGHVHRPMQAVLDGPVGADSAFAQEGQKSGQAIPPLAGALIKNEQDVQLFERLAFMSRRKERE